MSASVSYSELTPNCVVEYVDAHTKELLHTDYFHDPEQSWQRTKQGQIYLHSRHGGMPMPEWLKCNPKPSI
jgi:hypothetical protein